MPNGENSPSVPAPAHRSRFPAASPSVRSSRIYAASCDPPKSEPDESGYCKRISGCYTRCASSACFGRVIRTALAVAWLAAVGYPAPGAGAEWLTGASLRAKLAQPANVLWHEAPLRATLNKFSRAEQVALLIDRRVDPGQEIDAELQAVPVEAVFEQVAESRGLGLTRFGPVVYLGPPDVTARLRTLAEMRHDDVRRLPAPVAARLAESRPLAWDDFATPRAILERLAAEGRIEITGLDQIPHDLWAAADLPALPLVDRITLVAVQFDLTFQISAGQTPPDSACRLTLVPLPAEVAIVRSYPAGREPQKLVDKWQALAPQCRFKIAADKIYVKGRVEDLKRIEGGTDQPAAKREGGTQRARRGKSTKPPVTRFTGRVVDKPLGEVLQYIGTQLGLEMKIDREALARSGVSLDQLVSFSVKDASTDDLLEAVLGPAGCTYQRRGMTIEIKPAN